MAGPHYYPIDPTNYVRPKTFARSNVIEDDDLVNGNVEFWLDWDNGPIKPFFDWPAGTSVHGKTVGVGADQKTWELAFGGTYTADGNGAVSGTATFGFLYSSGAAGVSPWTRATIDLSVDVTIGTIGGGLFVRVNNENTCFIVYFDAASGRAKVQKRTPSATFWTGTAPVSTGQTRNLRVTIDASSNFAVYVDGVLDISFTDTYNSSYTGKWMLYTGGPTSKLSNVFGPAVAACPALTYDVVNDAGEIVASGAVSGYKVLVPDSALIQRNGLGPYGGYKLRLYGVSAGNYGTAKGNCEFVRVAPAVNFGPKPQPFTPVDPYILSGWDVELRSFFGMGPTRLAVSSGDVAGAAAYLDANYVALAHPSRPRHIIGAFAEDDEDNTTYMTTKVNALKAHIDAWEPLNEPNFQGYGGATWEPKQALFYGAVKAADPTALVLGPNVVSYNHGMDLWHDDFFGAGGADSLDGASVHGYNSTNGDIAMSRRLLAAFKARCDAYDLDMWQTEQSHHSQFGNLYMPAHAIRWTAVQLMVQETLGLPIERNVIWYDYSHGFTYTSLWETKAGITSVPVLVRTMIAELGDRTFESEFDIGDMVDFYVVARWAGTDGTSTVGVVAQSVGQPDVRFYLTGAESVVCCDGFGNEFTLTRGDFHIVTVAADVVPTWIRLPSGVSLTIVPEWDYGTNLALSGTVTSTGTAVNNTAFVSQLLENQYEYGIAGNPATGAGYNFETYNGTVGDTVTYPITVTCTFTAQTPTKLVLSSTPVWQTWFGTPTDFDIDVSADGVTWTTVHTQEPPDSTTSPFVSDLIGTNTTYDSWFDPQTVWAVDLPGTAITQVRLVVRAASWAGHETEADSTALWDAAWNPLTVRGLRLYSAEDFDPTERQRFVLTVTAAP